MVFQTCGVGIMKYSDYKTGKDLIVGNMYRLTTNPNSAFHRTSHGDLYSGEHAMYLGCKAVDSDYAEFFGSIYEFLYNGEVITSRHIEYLFQEANNET